MMTNTVRHLAGAGQERENLAVDRLLTLAPALHPRWLESLGIDPVKHWCLVRPKFKDIHAKLEEVEIDAVFGNLGAQKWPLSLDSLVAVEAKCWVVKRTDLEGLAKGRHAKTNLLSQVRRNFECGFDRVAGVDIISTEPSGNYMNALLAADTLGRIEMDSLREESRGQWPTTAGYAVFAFGAVAWKDECSSGALPMLKCMDAPPLEKHNRAVENAARTTLDVCPEPHIRPPYHFACRSGHWEIVPALC